MKSVILHNAINKPVQLIAVFILSTSISMAGAVYTHITSNYFIFPGFDFGNIYDSSMHIEMSFTTDSLLINFDGDATALVTSFSVSDGVHLLTEVDAGANFMVKTDSSGNIREWIVSFSKHAGGDFNDVGYTSIGVESRYTLGGLFLNDRSTTDVCTSKTFGTCNYQTSIAEAPAYSKSNTAWSVSEVLSPPIALSGTIKTSGGEDVCAMVLASGQYMFSCNPVGALSLTGLPRESDGRMKRQIYADGFFPKIDIRTTSTNEAVIMTRSGVCPSYNTLYGPAFVPGSAGKRINITGKVLLQDTQTPICAMVLANGQHKFSCDGTGSYALNIPLDNNGQYKLQVYADGFAPTIQIFDEFQTRNDVRMARAAECQ